MAIECGSQIVICDVPIRIDTYKGCSHGCKYCFVKKRTNIDDIKKDNCLESLAKHIKGKRNSETAWCDWDIPIHWGGLSDPFQPCEKRYRVSLKALRIFAESGYPFIVSTKGKLIAEPEYLELLDKCNSVVQISMVCDKYNKLEPGAPTYQERLEMCKKIAPHCKRLIIRHQPYMTDVLNNVLENIPKLKDAGAYGITIEGLKTTRAINGFVKCGGEFVYPVETLKRHYWLIKSACEKAGLHFFCAENRLRTMGESLCCCGCEGVEGFKTNHFNINHIVAGEVVESTEKMREIGTAVPFKAIYQDAGSYEYIKRNSMASIMLKENVYFANKQILTSKTKSENKLNKLDKSDAAYMASVVENNIK